MQRTAVLEDFDLSADSTTWSSLNDEAVIEKLDQIIMELLDETAGGMASEGRLMISNGNIIKNDQGQGLAADGVTREAPEAENVPEAPGIENEEEAEALFDQLNAIDLDGVEINGSYFAELGRRLLPIDVYRLKSTFKTDPESLKLAMMGLALYLQQVKLLQQGIPAREILGIKGQKAFFAAFLGIMQSRNAEALMVQLKPQLMAHMNAFVAGMVTVNMQALGQSLGAAAEGPVNVPGIISVLNRQAMYLAKHLGREMTGTVKEGTLAGITAAAGKIQQQTQKMAREAVGAVEAPGRVSEVVKSEVTRQATTALQGRQDVLTVLQSANGPTQVQNLQQTPQRMTEMRPAQGPTVSAPSLSAVRAERGAEGSSVLARILPEAQLARFNAGPANTSQQPAQAGAALSSPAPTNTSYQTQAPQSRGAGVVSPAAYQTPSAPSVAVQPESRATPAGPAFTPAAYQAPSPVQGSGTRPAPAPSQPGNTSETRPAHINAQPSPVRDLAEARAIEKGGPAPAQIQRDGYTASQPADKTAVQDPISKGCAKCGGSNCVCGQAEKAENKAGNIMRGKSYTASEPADKAAVQDPVSKGCAKCGGSNCVCGQAEKAENKAGNIMRSSVKQGEVPSQPKAYAGIKFEIGTDIGKINRDPISACATCGTRNCSECPAMRMAAAVKREFTQASTTSGRHQTPISQANRDRLKTAQKINA